MSKFEGILLNIHGLRTTLLTFEGIPDKAKLSKYFRSPSRNLGSRAIAELTSLFQNSIPALWKKRRE